MKQASIYCTYPIHPSVNFRQNGAQLKIEVTSKTQKENIKIRNKRTINNKTLSCKRVSTVLVTLHVNQNTCAEIDDTTYLEILCVRSDHERLGRQGSP